MHTRTVRPPPPDEPTVTDDPFADLLDALEMEEDPRSDDDGTELQRLFSTAPPRPGPRADAPPGSPWPTHNYGPAYRSLRRDTGGRRRPPVLSESDLWDVDRLTHEPVPEPAVAETVHAPWRAAAPAADPHGWLDTLDARPVDPATTEARLVDVAWGRPLHPIVLEASEVLHARPRKMVAAGARHAPRSPLLPKPVRVAALGLLLLFALALLQLLLS